MSEKNQGLQHMGRGRWKLALLLGNDKNNIIADKVLSYCLSAKFEAYIARFRTK